MQQKKLFMSTLEIIFFVGILGYNCQLLYVTVLPGKSSKAPCKMLWNWFTDNLTQNNFVRQLHGATENFIFFVHPHCSLVFMFESFKQANMAIVCKEICSEEFVLLLEKGIYPEWWDRKVHKTTYKIVLGLIDYSSEVKYTQPNARKVWKLC